MIALDLGQSEKVDLTPIYNSLSYHQYEIDLLKSKPPKNVSFDVGFPEVSLMNGYYFLNKGMYGDYKNEGGLIPFPEFGKPYVWNHHGLAVYIHDFYQGWYFDIFELCAGAIEANAMNMGINNFFPISIANDLHTRFQADHFTFITYPSMLRNNEGYVNGIGNVDRAYLLPHGGHTTSYSVTNSVNVDGYTSSFVYSFSLEDINVFSSMLLPNYTKCSYYYYTTSTWFTMAPF